MEYTVEQFFDMRDKANEAYECKASYKAIDNSVYNKKAYKQKIAVLIGERLDELDMGHCFIVRILAAELGVSMSALRRAMLVKRDYRFISDDRKKGTYKKVTI